MTPTNRTLNRRQLLQIGGIGAIGLGLPELLRAGTPNGSARRSRAKSCIFIVQYGGASHIDSLDPKPDAPDDIRGPYKPIATAFPACASASCCRAWRQLADRYCLVRSMTHGNGGHDGGMHVCMTGHSQPAAEHALFRLGHGQGCGRPRATCRPTSGCRTWPATCSRATSPAASSARRTARCASAPTWTIRPRADFRFTAFDPRQGRSARADCWRR